MGTEAFTTERLSGKVAIITGGASGIGASAVKLFQENGATVIIADIQDQLGQALACKLGKKVSYIHCNISDEDDVRNLVDKVVAEHGKLDIMFNNAGIIDRPFGSILDTQKSDLEQLLAVNVVGSFLGAKHAARVMIKQRRGCILFTASASTAIAGLGTPAYTVTKNGIVGLARTLAAELGEYGVRVNCISPFGVLTGIAGPIDEGDIPRMEERVSAMGNLKGHVLKPEGVAQAAMYLASDDADYVSGLNLVVDGGYSVVNPTMMKAMSSKET